MRTHKTRPPIFPQPWASSWGEDEYGLWMAFTYKRVEQKFRWVEPGIFLMGSLDDEQKTHNNEIQHQVTVTQGYWLAETTVTQALWESVMGNNPSSFAGENRPVETVSWNDSQEFILKVNQLKSELLLGLPTEVQWEYACRAGTSTLFSFGDQANEQQANYLSSQTEVVKKYPSNDWGFFDMHGNVWEWCEDEYEVYTFGSEVELIRTGGNSTRVLRGGSWNTSASHLRSAARTRSGAGFRYNYIGFRLVVK